MKRAAGGAREHGDGSATGPRAGAVQLTPGTARIFRGAERGVAAADEPAFAAEAGAGRQGAQRNQREDQADDPKRSTTLVSATPWCWKEWWAGARKNMRRPMRLTPRVS